ncbi:MAG: hypothetical protein AW09_004520 [Candidatus Accumulibacter phosphatis]|uniref:Uncharacterized protein n=1 Tax=Candidatus Accumulibacter phosphatis TaxID=327160 RepID=A0A084Y6N6_9PROT|nr:MAG: hypothetical protein AW09_004520 [Candidatus Accumulibacter phosphatis]
MFDLRLCNQHAIEGVTVLIFHHAGPARGHTYPESQFTGYYPEPGWVESGVGTFQGLGTR